MIEIYTDGACIGNPGPGGWAWVTDGHGQGSGGEDRTTNQRMELRAVIEALRAHDGEVCIVSDSTYVINCFKDSWWVKWERNGWRNAKADPVANADLWRDLIDLVNGRVPPVTFRWVKGHAGVPLNEAADALAQTQARTHQRRQ